MTSRGGFNAPEVARRKRSSCAVLSARLVSWFERTASEHNPDTARLPSIHQELRTCHPVIVLCFPTEHWLKSLYRKGLASVARLFQFCAHHGLQVAEKTNQTGQSMWRILTPHIYITLHVHDLYKHNCTKNILLY